MPRRSCITEGNNGLVPLKVKYKGLVQMDKSGCTCSFCEQKGWIKMIYNLHVHRYVIFHFTTGCFKDHLVGEDLIADYLLYILNKTKNFE